jgi:hypothetical protein
MARICNNGMTFCSVVGSETSIGALLVFPGPKGEKTPSPDPPPACAASRAVNGLSMGGSDRSTGIEGSPIGEDAGKGEGDEFIRACMNWCRCSGNQEEGSGGGSVSPSKISAFREGVVPLRFGERLGETLLRFGVGILSSGRKLVGLSVIFGRGGSTDALGVSWLYVVRFIYLFTDHREDRLERPHRVLKL